MNMSYCQYENTLGDMRQLLADIEESDMSFNDYLDSLSRSERNSLFALAEAASNFVQIVENGIDEEGYEEDEETC